MSIRGGDSATFKWAQVQAASKVVESRRYMDWQTDWKDIAGNCVKYKKFSITTICLNYAVANSQIPTEQQWRDYVEDTVVKLLAKGINWNNGRIDIINEPTKHVRDSNNVIDHEKYVWLVNVAHDQIAGRLKMGFGCEELIYTGWQEYIAGHCKGEVYVIHIQATCSSESKLIRYCTMARDLAKRFNKEIDCNEINYSDVSTSEGYQLMKLQFHYAELIGCSNAPNVFNDLRKEAYPKKTDHWHFLCFKINGAFRSSKAKNHYNDWIALWNIKAPVPNIKEVYTMYGIELNYVKPGCHNEECRAAQQVMLDEGYNLGEWGADSWYGEVTEAAIKAWQKDNNLTVDGIIGPNTWDWIIANLYTGSQRFTQMLARTARYK